MVGRKSAMIRVVGVGGQAVELSWLQGVVLPRGVRVDVADTGTRIDVTAQLGVGTMSVVADVSTGVRVAEEVHQPSTELRALVDQLVRQRIEANPGRRSARITTQRSKPVSRIMFEKLNWPLGGYAPDPDSPEGDDEPPERRTDAEE